MTPVTAWDALPLVLDVKHMALVLNRSSRWVLDKCKDRTIYPPPMRWAKPYQWGREAVRQSIEAMPLTKSAPRRRVSAPVTTIRTASREEVRREMRRLMGGL